MTVAVLLVVAGAVVYFAIPDRREFVDRARVNLTRTIHGYLYRRGRALPGTPDLAKFDERLAAAGIARGAPVYVRVFKLESEIELWVQKDGRFDRFATYPICMWSGRLGPKFKEGDRQAPEGFYTVDKDALNPNSRMHLSFNLGFPNVYDRGKGRTGSFLMVHGGCASIGCYAVTDGVVDEIWRMVTAALDNGQERFPVHVFPFRMTADNFEARKSYAWSGFWSDLKTGYDLFERSNIPPVVSVCEGHYVFAPGRSDTVGRPIEERCPPSFAENP